MDKIKMTTPLVEMDGDEMTRIFWKMINSQEDVRVLIYEHIHEILPVFIDNLFQSDYTVLFSRKNIYDRK